MAVMALCLVLTFSLAVMLDEVAQCADYGWSKLHEHVVVGAYLAFALFMILFAGERGFASVGHQAEEWIGYATVHKNKVVASVAVFVLFVQPLATKVGHLDSIDVDDYCPLPKQDAAKGLFQR